MPIKQEHAEAAWSRMASAEKRQRRRKKCWGGQPRADSCDLMDSDKSSDYVERLAHKYMRKCTVESSTESESESNNELNSCAAGLRHVVELMQKLSAGCASNAYSCHQRSAVESGFDFPTCWQQLPQISVILQRTFPPITLMDTR
ncbi:uncharacterized protein LOC120403789 isoform X5 [Mauremys reevesii]|uniref:uncharacterized protein LOC120403789 isoform X5 n=1 Tax=Mauremys reevesii TaxID=260615 RepID=UPI00193F6053|nr:uncharacterized protein LOC120403789 isoform X5 [Mauremys reevesii]